ncbi:MAG: carotenoid oxygenase family protein [Thermosynechococcaceae cyanobacterium]
MTQARITSEDTNLQQDQHSSRKGFPQSILSVSREELSDLPLTIKKGLTEEEAQLPNDLTGHVFIIGPAGSIPAGVVSDEDLRTIKPAKDGWTPLFNGDGMIYRFDFGQGAAQLKTRLVKPPCYYADLATQTDAQYRDLQFQNVGISRMAWNSLGVRNQLNTALVPVKSAQDQHERLLVTWDVGRPYEIDPVTLEVIAPVGWNDEWRALTSFVKVRPFKQVMTAAHPGYDPNCHELFTVNVGKSFSTLLSLSRSVNARLNKQRESIQAALSEPSSPLSQITELVSRLFKIVLRVLGFVDKVLQHFARHDFVNVMRWDISSSHLSETWQVRLPNGRPLKIDETLHQIGLTKDYLVLADTSFKLALEHFLPYQKSQISEDAKVLFADLFDYPQLDITKLYFVRRADLKSSPPQRQGIPKWLRWLTDTKRPTVTAQSVELPFEMAHYLVDYDNPDGKVTLHATHNCATDPAEYIRIFDRSVFDDRDGKGDYDEAAITANVQRLAGTVVGPMDVSRLAGYVINPETGTVEASDYAYSLDYNWSTALYAYRDDYPTGQFKDIYWSSWGCWHDTLTKRNFEAYKDYKKGAENGRIVPQEEVLRITREGRPSSLCHLHIGRNSADEADKPIQLTLNEENCYSFPAGYLGTSPQFVPRKGSAANDSTEGYIISVVLYSDTLSSKSEPPPEHPSWSQNSELWIFDAKDLKSGPLYRLSHGLLNFGFTLHTTWLQDIASAPVSHDYDIRKDHDPLIQEQPEEVRAQIQALFEAEVYPRFERGESHPK